MQQWTCCDLFAEGNICAAAADPCRDMSGVAMPNSMSAAGVVVSKLSADGVRAASGLGLLVLPCKQAANLLFMIPRQEAHWLS